MGLGPLNDAWMLFDNSMIVAGNDRAERCCTNLQGTYVMVGARPEAGCCAGARNCIGAHSLCTEPVLSFSTMQALHALLHFS